MTYSEDIRVLPRKSYQNLPTETNIFCTNCGLLRRSTNTPQHYVRIISKRPFFSNSSKTARRTDKVTVWLTVIFKAQYLSFLMSLPRLSGSCSCLHHLKLWSCYRSNKTSQRQIPNKLVISWIKLFNFLNSILTWLEDVALHTISIHRWRKTN